jgi:hypothetical protein
VFIKSRCYNATTLEEMCRYHRSEGGRTGATVDPPAEISCSWQSRRAHLRVANHAKAFHAHPGSRPVGSPVWPPRGGRRTGELPPGGEPRLDPGEPVGVLLPGRSRCPHSLIVSNTYHPLWRVIADGREISPQPSYYFVSSYDIDKVGEYDLTLEFVGQRYQWFAFTLSGLTYGVTIVALVVCLLRARRRGGESASEVTRSMPLGG